MKWDYGQLRSRFGEWASFYNGRALRWGRPWLSTTVVRGVWPRELLWTIAYRGYTYTHLKVPRRPEAPPGRG